MFLPVIFQGDKGDRGLRGEKVSPELLKFLKLDMT